MGQGGLFGIGILYVNHQIDIKCSLNSNVATFGDKCTFLQSSEMHMAASSWLSPRSICKLEDSRFSPAHQRLYSPTHEIPVRTPILAKFDFGS